MVWREGWQTEATVMDTEGLEATVQRFADSMLTAVDRKRYDKACA